MTTDTLSRRLADFAVAAYTDGIPEDVARSTRERVLDVVGLCLAATTLDTSRQAHAFALAQRTSGPCTAIGLGSGLAAPQAAFVNGVLAHSLDFDDTHLPSVLHPSASVVPAALAAAQAHGRDGEQAIRAAAVGIEVVVRTGMAGYDRDLGNSIFFEHGQHATSICGTLGAAVAASLLAGADADGVADALGLAASMAGGVIEANRTGGTVKRLHCGWAAQAGVSAAELARHGFTGPPTVLEGRFGFFEAFLHGPGHPEEVTDGLGTDWAVPGIFFKPYPSNHFTHALIDAGLAFRAQGITPDDVARVRLGVPAAVIRTIGQPLDAKRAPATGYQAQFSGPYAFAAGLFGGGGLGVAREDFSDALAADPARRALMARTDVEPDAACDAIFPHQFPARVTVTLADGATRSVFVEANRGGPQRPLSADELLEKFLGNAAAALDAPAARTLGERCLALDTEASLDAVLASTLTGTTHPGGS